MRAIRPRGAPRRVSSSAHSAGESDSALIAEITMATEIVTANCW